MIIKYDLSKEGIERYERKNLLYTIDEMLAMDNKQRWANLIVITHLENWMEDNKKIITAQTLMYLIELEKGWLESTWGVNNTFIEHFIIVKWGKEKVPPREIARRIKRGVRTINKILRLYDIPIKLYNAKKVVITTHDGLRFVEHSVEEIARVGWIDIRPCTLARKLNKQGVYTNDVATFYYEEVEEGWRQLH